MAEDHDTNMALALDEARKAEAAGNLPVGSVILRDGQIVASGANEVLTASDVTAHAETVVIRQASAAAGPTGLAGSTLYTTLEPCPMCCGAIINAGITTVVVGGRLEGSERTNGEYTFERLLELTGNGSRVTVVQGVLRNECLALVTPEKRREYLQRVQRR